MGVYLIPLERKYDAILCLFLLEIVLIGPVAESVEGMLEEDGRPERLGLGKPRAFLAVGRLGGRCPTKIKSIPQTNKREANCTTNMLQVLAFLWQGVAEGLLSCLGCCTEERGPWGRMLSGPISYNLG